MLGEPLSNSIRDELDRRKKGLNRDNGLPNLGSGLEYLNLATTQLLGLN